MAKKTKKPSLGDAVRSAETPEALRSIILGYQGKIADAWAGVANHGRAIDEGLLLGILESRISLHGLLGNPRRPKNTEAVVARWALNRLLGDVTRELLDGAESALRLLILKKALPFEGDVMQELVALTIPKKKSQKALLKRQLAAIRLLALHPDTPQDAINRLYDLATQASDTDLTLSVLKHPRSSREQWLRFIGDEPDGSVVWAAIRHDGIRLDPECRRRIVDFARKMPTTGLLTTLIADGCPEDCAELFRKLCARNSVSDAAMALESAPERVAPNLTRTDLEPLFTSLVPRTRMAAVTCLALVADGEDATVTTPSEAEPKPGRSPGRS